nr:hypothetical protein [Tanacetum cinerariifolium]
MYNVDMKDIVPKENLTCLVAKATLDESMGKQQKASCKSKIQNSISQTLFMLHMDLFGPIFMSSLMHKKYGLVVTNDYIRCISDEGVALVDETHGRSDQDMFDTSIFDDEEVVAEKEVSTAGEVVTTAKEEVTTAGVKVSTAAITSHISMDEITLAKALIDIKTSKPKAKGIVIQELSETSTPTPIDSSQQSSKAKDKSKAKMIEPEKPLKRKDQIMIDEKVSRNLE